MSPFPRVEVTPFYDAPPCSTTDSSMEQDGLQKPGVDPPKTALDYARPPWDEPYIHAYPVDAPEHN